MSALTRVAVIGTGAMGHNHARIYRELPEADLIGVCDQDPGGARATAALYVSEAYTDHRQLLKACRPDAVSIAVPTMDHHRIALDALEAGCHVLVEKPIAASVAEGREMVGAARTAGRVLMVGHVERFNPAILELKRRLAGGELGRVFQAHARRLGPFPSRVRDVGVVVDLATHDLDVMRYLSGSEAIRIYAETKREVHTSNEDLVLGLLRFANEMVGVLEINWLTPTKIRELSVTGERGMFVADYLTQDLTFYENAESEVTPWETLSVLRGVREGAMIRYAIAKVEPLRAELQAFLRAAAGEDDSEVVTGSDGVAALDLAMALIHSSHLNEPVRVAT